MSDLCAKVVTLCFTTDEVIHFSINIFGNRVESICNKENIFREEGDAEFDPVDVSGIDSDIQKKVLRR